MSDSRLPDYLDLSPEKFLTGAKLFDIFKIS